MHRVILLLRSDPRFHVKISNLRICVINDLLVDFTVNVFILPKEKCDYICLL